MAEPPLVRGRAEIVVECGIHVRVDGGVERGNRLRVAGAAVAVDAVMSAAGRAVSSQNRSRAEVDAFATAVGDMFCAWLTTHGAASRARRAR